MPNVREASNATPMVAESPGSMPMIIPNWVDQRIWNKLHGFMKVDIALPNINKPLNIVFSYGSLIRKMYWKTAVINAEVQNATSTAVISFLVCDLKGIVRSYSKIAINKEIYKNVSNRNQTFPNKNKYNKQMKIVMNILWVEISLKNALKEEPETPTRPLVLISERMNTIIPNPVMTNPSNLGTTPGAE